jgi:hypothetical protein
VAAQSTTGSCYFDGDGGLDKLWRCSKKKKRIERECLLQLFKTGNLTPEENRVTVDTIQSHWLRNNLSSHCHYCNWGSSG